MVSRGRAMLEFQVATPGQTAHWRPIMSDSRDSSPETPQRPGTRTRSSQPKRGSDSSISIAEQISPQPKAADSISSRPLFPRSLVPTALGPLFPCSLGPGPLFPDPCSLFPRSLGPCLST